MEFKHIKSTHNLTFPFDLATGTRCDAMMLAHLALASSPPAEPVWHLGYHLSVSLQLNIHLH